MSACMHRRIDAWMHGHMDAWMHGHMDACLHGRMNAWRMDAWTHGCTVAWLHGYMDAWMHGCMVTQMHECIRALVHGYMDAWAHGRVGPWMHKCISKLITCTPPSATHAHTWCWAQRDAVQPVLPSGKDFLPPCFRRCRPVGHAAGNCTENFRAAGAAAKQVITAQRLRLPAVKKCAVAADMPEEYGADAGRAGRQGRTLVGGPADVTASFYERCASVARRCKCLATTTRRGARIVRGAGAGHSHLPTQTCWSGRDF
eukprot:365298-Chlamydomonas_euryale.AAC.5